MIISYETIRDIRLILGLSEAQAARRAKIPVRRLRLIEKGTWSPDTDEIASLAKAYGCIPWVVFVPDGLVPIQGLEAMRRA